MGISKKYLLISFITIALFLGLCGTAAAADTIHVNESLFIHIGSGDTMTDALGLGPFTWSLNANYILVEDIDLSSGFTPIGNWTDPFTGTFDGQD
ncbi:MAG: hypothetical protein LBE57_04455 [Methanosarcinales archaeon]|jgi:hypothetical protein|nr:hypothetical protein [Methanosarcinales archaeon]